MAVSPADFELYSRVTGRAVPRSPQERMKMAPAVNKFIKNREYERPQQTTLQKGADLLGKAALIGGALAAGHAIGGGFRGKTAENVGKVADVVQNLAKTGVVGAEGGKVVQNVAKTAAGMAPLSNEVYGALQQEEMLNNLAQDTVLPAKPEGSAQISLSDKGNALADRILNRPGSDLDSLDNIRGDIPPNTGGEGGPSLDSGPTPRRPHGGMSRMEKLMNQEEARADVYDEVWGKPLDDAFETAIALDDERDIRSSSIAPITPDEGGFRGPYVRDDQLATTSSPSIQQKVGAFLGGQRQWGIDTLDTISRQGGGRDLRQSAPALGGAIAGRGLIPGTGGGLLPGSGTSLGQNAVSGFWDAAGNLARRDPMIGGAARGLEGIGNINVFGNSVGDAVGNAFGAVPGLNEAVNLGGVKIAELGGLGLGTVADSAVKDTLKLGVDARRFAENRFGFRPLSWQQTAVQTGDLIDQGWARDEAAKIAARNNPLLAEGMGRHDEAISSLQRNIQAALPTTRPTGQIAIGENAQLNRHPDLPPGETDMAPSRAIQQFSDRRISGEGSLTPGDRSDLSALLSGSSAELGPDETVSGDIEIRTDVGVDDPVNFTQLFGKRVGKREKDKFIAGLQERNEDVYSGEGATGMRRGRSSDPEKRFQPFHEVNFGSDLHIPTKGSRKGQVSRLPKRKIEGKGKMGSMGVAGSMAGVADWEDRDAKDPLHGLKQFARGVMEEPDLSDNAAEEVGRRIAEREEQGSTKWVRSPDGKLRREKIDDPWES